MIAVWAVLGVLLAVLGQTLVHRVTETQAGDFLPETYDSAVAQQVAEKEFGVTPDANTVTVLVARSDDKPLTPVDRQRIATETEELGRRRLAMPTGGSGLAFLRKDHSQTPRTSPGTVAPDRRFALFSVDLTGNAADPGLRDLFREFRDDAESAFSRVGLRTGFTGGLADTVDTADAEANSFEIAIVLALGLIVLLSALVFRSVLAAVVPLLAVVLVGGAAAGAVAGVALLTGITLDTSTPQLINVVLLGIGIDYFLFLLFRFREQLRAHPRQHGRDAAAEVTGRLGTAITSAALTVVAAFATLGVASFGQFRVLGPAIAVSVLVMLLAGLTLMPALLAAAGRAMFRPSQALKGTPRASLAGRFGALVARRPLTLVLASVALLGALAAGMVGMRMDYGQPGSTSSGGTAASDTGAEISRSLPAGVRDPTTVYVTAENGETLTPKKLDGLTHALTRTKGVGKAGATTFTQDRKAARIDLYLTADPQSRKARDLVTGPVRAAVARHTPAGTQAHVGGTAAVLADVADAVDHDLKTVFPVAAALIALMLLVLLRSLLAPVILIIAIGLGFAATLGACALVYQHLLDKPGVDFTLPLVLFLFVVALGTDYSILISDRIREEMERPGPARAAVARAVRHTAPAIATAGLVLAGSFGSLAVNLAPAARQIGFATALGIVLSAYVLSIVLVPALAALLGRDTWWPIRAEPLVCGGEPPHTRKALRYEA
ncbi:MMPL family transporter [Streptomyces sp. NPDC059063]|uniref:MMPL family transporter n=1 Tax=unclassified Streptomyces TaxID=2593676 RepID=UPI00367F042F